MSVSKWFDDRIQGVSDWLSTRLVTEWYAIISFIIILVLAATVRLSPVLSTWYQRSRVFFLRRFAYTRLLNVPILQHIFLLLYLGVNIFCLMFQYKDGKSHISSIPEVMLRCGTLSSINIIPLFLGRRSTVYNFLGIRLPIHVRLLFHHWIGTLSVSLCFVHIILSVVTGTHRNSMSASGIFVSFPSLHAVL